MIESRAFSRKYINTPALISKNTPQEYEIRTTIDPGVVRKVLEISFLAFKRFARSSASEEESPLARLSGHIITGGLVLHF